MRRIAIEQPFVAHSKKLIRLERRGLHAPHRSRVALCSTLEETYQACTTRTTCAASQQSSPLQHTRRNLLALQDEDYMRRIAVEQPFVAHSKKLFSPSRRGLHAPHRSRVALCSTLEETYQACTTRTTCAASQQSSPLQHTRRNLLGFHDEDYMRRIAVEQPLVAHLKKLLRLARRGLHAPHRSRVALCSTLEETYQACTTRTTCAASQQSSPLQHT